VEKLRAAVVAHDVAAARHHAHALAGAAGNLGADELRQAAKNLELATVEGNSDLTELFRLVDERAGIVFGSLESLRVQPTGPSPPGHRGKVSEHPNAAQNTVDPIALRACLERLRTAVDDGDLSGATEVLKGIIDLDLPEPTRGRIMRMQQFVDMYEYDKAREAVNELLSTPALRG
jgi:HPt (histidine-containing phosphotransfer) domain-containing protein